MIDKNKKCVRLFKKSCALIILSLVKKRYCFLLSCFFIFSLFLCSCGLDVFYFLEPPILEAISNPDIQANRQYSFFTNDNANVRPEIADVFKGTIVYYKIYNDKSTLDSAVSSINSINTSYSQNGMNQLKSLGYRTLQIKDSTSEILFSKNGLSRKIVIRLFREGDASNPFLSGVFINGTSMGLPARFNDIDFDITDGSQIPVKTDADVQYKEPSSVPDTWYVSAYAVNVGTDPYLAPVYSQLLYLGSIKLNNF